MISETKKEQNPIYGNSVTYSMGVTNISARGAFSYLLSYMPRYFFKKHGITYKDVKVHVINEIAPGKLIATVTIYF